MAAAVTAEKQNRISVIDDLANHRNVLQIIREREPHSSHSQLPQLKISKRATSQCGSGGTGDVDLSPTVCSEAWLLLRRRRRRRLLVQYSKLVVTVWFQAAFCACKALFASS